MCAKKKFKAKIKKIIKQNTFCNKIYIFSKKMDKNNKLPDTNNKLSIKIDSRTNNNSIRFVSKKLKFPNDFPCEILDLEIYLNRNGSLENTQESEEEAFRYTGGISGIFSVPNKKFSKSFAFKIPLSLKFGTAIALSFCTNEISDEKLQVLNQFVFGDESIKPIVITKEISIEIATYLLESSKGFEGLKKIWEKALKFLKENDIALNFIIDHSQKKYAIGFYWKEFHLEGIPENLQIEDILFGLSLGLKEDAEKKIALKIGGKATYGKDKENRLYLEYERDNVEQRLELGATISCLTTILQKMSVSIPSQLQDFSENTTMNLEWVSDVKKNISAEMKLEN